MKPLYPTPFAEVPVLLERVISGGQTGADRGGLAAAKAAGIATGGWMPKGFRAQDGARPEFAEVYGVKEHASSHYPPRTALNVKESDATLRFATDWDSPGEVLTLEMCERYGRPHLEVAPGGALTPADVAAWLVANSVRVLNVAGNAERTSPGIEAFVVTFLTEVFRLLRDHADFTSRARGREVRRCGTFPHAPQVESRLTLEARLLFSRPSK